MKVTHGSSNVIAITGFHGLDPVTIFIQDHKPGEGSLTVTCAGSAWTAWWGGMGPQISVRRFVSQVGTDYLAGCLVRGDVFHARLNKKQELYLHEIIQEVQAALKQDLAPAETKS